MLHLSFVTILIIAYFANAQLYSFTSPFNFTTCGASGRYGPTLTQIQSAYNQPWTRNSSYLTMGRFQGLQVWTVPATGVYRITAAGAAGGGAGSGNGAILTGDFELTQGTKLWIAVGQRGSTGTGSRSGNSGGGGGGTFILKEFSGDMIPNTNILMIAGGGGGGAGDDGNIATNDRQPAPNTANGRINNINGESTFKAGGGGVDGNGAQLYRPGDDWDGISRYAAGGAGLLSNGAPGDSNAGSTGGKCFLQGLVGGDAGAGTISKRTGHGGFGGGAGSSTYNTCRGGGAGGFSGGQGGAYGVDKSINTQWSIYRSTSSSDQGYGGGGGSVNYGFNTANSVNPNKQDGYVTIRIVSCGPGLFIWRTEECRACDAGFYSIGSFYCLKCHEGSYSPVQSSTCFDCGLGATAVAGSSSCYCRAGYQIDGILCSPCPSGSVKAVDGNGTVCSPCRANSYSSSDRLLCITCPLNSVSSPGSSSCQCSHGYGFVNGVCTICSAGSFKSTIGNQACTPCSANTFSATPGSTSCQQCQNAVSTLGSATCTCNAGFYKLNGACTACPLGSSKATVGDESCSLCSAGQFQDATGATTCKSCSAGTFQSAAGASSCNLCPSGTFSTTFGATSDTICQKCPINTFSSSVGASSSSACIACVANSSTQGRLGVNDSSFCVCNVGFQGSGINGCAPCAINNYKDTVGNTGCKSCGTNAGTIGMSGSDVCYCLANFYGDPKVACTACPPNTFKTSATSIITDVSVCSVLPSCAAGFFGNPAVSCTRCPVNTYRSGVSFYATTIDDCIACVANASTSGFTAAISASQCFCDSGFYGDGGSRCTLCPPNTYKPTSGNGAINSCLPCTANSTTLGRQGSTNIDACICDAGYSGSGSTLCTACLPGLFKPTTGNGLCTKCAAGTFQNSSGATSCQSCSGNTFQSNEGSATCLACGMNAIVDSEKTSCFCLPNTYGNPLINCTSCPPNFSRQGSTTSNTTLANCLEDSRCNPGFFGVPGSCSPCPASTYQPNVFYSTTTITACLRCPNNSVIVDIATGATSISSCVCSPGYFRDANSQTGCTQCPVNTYKSSASNANSCDECPVGTTTNGRQSIKTVNECVCMAGHFGRDPKSCIPCREDSFKANAGFADSCTPCGEQSLTAGEVGSSCASACLCKNGHFKNSTGSCVACPIDSYKTGISNVGKCELCPPSTSTRGSIGATTSSDCLCSPGLVGSAIIGCFSLCGPNASYDEDLDVCICKAGFFKDGDGCVPCSIGTFKSEAGNQTCTRCPGMTTTRSIASIVVDSCLCPRGFFGYENTDCTPCPVNTFKSTINDSNCTVCAKEFSTGGQVGAENCSVCATNFQGTPPNCQSCRSGFAKSEGNGFCVSINGPTNTTTNTNTTTTPKDAENTFAKLFEDPVVRYAVIGGGSALILTVIGTTIYVRHQRKKRRNLDEKKRKQAEEANVAMAAAQSTAFLFGGSANPLIPYGPGMPVMMTSSMNASGSLANLMATPMQMGQPMFFSMPPMPQMGGNTMLAEMMSMGQMPLNNKQNTQRFVSNANLSTIGHL